MTISIYYFAFINFNCVRGICDEAEHITSHIPLLVHNFINVFLQLLRLLICWETWNKICDLKDLDTVWEAEVRYDG